MIVYCWHFCLYCLTLFIEVYILCIYLLYSFLRHLTLTLLNSLKGLNHFPFLDQFVISIWEVDVHQPTSSIELGRLLGCTSWHGFRFQQGLTFVPFFEILMRFQFDWNLCSLKPNHRLYVQNKSIIHRRQTLCLFVSCIWCFHVTSYDVICSFDVISRYQML